MKLLALLLLTLILFSCSKEKSKKWLVADVTVLDKYTGEPLQCELVLKWKTGKIGGNSSHSTNIGQTDAQGKMHIEREISRKDGSFQLEIWADHTHYGFPGLYQPQRTVGLLQSQGNEVFVELPSKSYIVLSILNANCSGATDTLLLRNIHSNYEGPYTEYVGCVDTIINGQMAYTGYIINPSLQFQYIVKRGSQVDTFNETHILTPKEFTPINIVY